jgi:hypothetical protein
LFAVNTILIYVIPEPLKDLVGGFLFGAAFHLSYEINYTATSTTTKATVGIGLWIKPKGGCAFAAPFVRLERTGSFPIVGVYSNVVMLENLGEGDSIGLPNQLLTIILSRKSRCNISNFP